MAHQALLSLRRSQDEPFLPTLEPVSVYGLHGLRTQVVTGGEVDLFYTAFTSKARATFCLSDFRLKRLHMVNPLGRDLHHNYSAVILQ